MPATGLPESSGLPLPDTVDFDEDPLDVSNDVQLLRQVSPRDRERERERETRVSKYEKESSSNVFALYGLNHRLG